MSLKRVNFSPLHTFARATVKNVFQPEPDGFGGTDYILKEVASGAPAFAWNPETGESLGISIEESRTNLLKYSEQFDESVWDKTASGTGSAPVITPNAAVAPDGTTTATRAEFALNGGTGSSNFSVITQISASPSGATNTSSIWLRSNTELSYDMILYNSAIGTAANKKVTVAPDAWTRIETSGVLPATSTSFNFGLRNLSGASELSDSADILIWGAQIEVGANPSSYIKTEATTVTRLADVCTIEDLSGWFNQSQGSIVFEVDVPPSGGSVKGLLTISDAADTVLFDVRHQSNLFRISSGASLIASIPPTPLVTGGKARVAVAWEGLNFSITTNGGAVASGVGTSAAGAATQARVGNLKGGNFYYNGSIASIQHYPQAVSDTQLQELSAL